MKFGANLSYLIYLGCGSGINHCHRKFRYIGWAWSPFRITVAFSFWMFGTHKVFTEYFTNFGYSLYQASSTSSMRPRRKNAERPTFSIIFGLAYFGAEGFRGLSSLWEFVKTAVARIARGMSNATLNVFDEAFTTLGVCVEFFRYCILCNWWSYMLLRTAGITRLFGSCLERNISWSGVEVGV